MFMAAGLVYAALGHDRIADLAGVARAMPVTVLAFAVAGLALMGVVPSGAYLAKKLHARRRRRHGTVVVDDRAAGRRGVHRGVRRARAGQRAAPSTRPDPDGEAREPTVRIRGAGARRMLAVARLRRTGAGAGTISSRVPSSLRSWDRRCWCCWAARCLRWGWRAGRCSRPTALAPPNETGRRVAPWSRWAAPSSAPTSLFGAGRTRASRCWRWRRCSAGHLPDPLAGPAARTLRRRGARRRLVG